MRLAAGVPERYFMTMGKDEVKELKDGKQVSGFWALMNVVGGVSGLTSLVVVAVFIGGLKKQVEINTGAIHEIQQGGSPTLKETVKALSLEVESRKESDGINNRRIDDLRVDFLDRMHSITALLQEQVAQQTALIALIRSQQQVKGP